MRSMASKSQWYYSTWWVKSIFLIIFFRSEIFETSQLSVCSSSDVIPKARGKMFLAVIVQTQFLFIFIPIKSCGGHSLIKTWNYTDWREICQERKKRTATGKNKEKLEQQTKKLKINRTCLSLICKKCTEKIAKKKYYKINLLKSFSCKNKTSFPKKNIRRKFGGGKEIKFSYFSAIVPNILKPLHSATSIK